MIKQIAHLAFNVKDMKQSLEFYQNVLGFEKAFELMDYQNKPWIVYLKVCENQYIELFYTTHTEFENKPNIGYAHLCLEVDDIHTIANHIRSKSVKLDVEPLMGKDNNYQCWVKDPDGNSIEFMQYGVNSLQRG